MPQLGKIIEGKYKIEEKLGEGGMGAVYKAVHTRIGGSVAFKFLNIAFSEQPEAIRRFQQEAVAAARIGHEAIIRTHDIGVTDEGEHYIVMEYLKGESLGQMLERGGTLPPDLATYVACHVLSGLAAAHRKGIVHRDLKPDNIFLVSTGASLPAVKILDFGISRISDPSHNNQLTRLTRTGSIMGTPEYMSPEQARGLDDVDHRADIYALGVILFETLAGRVPFTGNNYNAVLVSIINNEAPELSAVAADVPEPLEKIVSRALHKDRAVRYQSATSMLADLMPLLDEAMSQTIPLLTESEGDSSKRALAPETLHVSSSSSPAKAAHSPNETNTAWEKNTPHDDKKQRLKPWSIAAVLAVIVVVGAGIAVGLSFNAETPDPPEPATDLAPSKAASALVVPDEDELKMVTLTVSNVPSKAKVFVDDKAVKTNPTEIQWDDNVHRVRVEAEGFEPFEEVFVPTRDRTIEVELVKLVKLDKQANSPERSRSQSKSVAKTSKRPPRQKTREKQRPYTPSLFKQQKQKTPYRPNLFGSEER